MNHQQSRIDHTRIHTLPYTLMEPKEERVTSFTFLGVHISEVLFWTLNTSTLIKKAQQHLYFLRKPHPAEL